MRQFAKTAQRFLDLPTRQEGQASPARPNSVRIFVTPAHCRPLYPLNPFGQSFARTPTTERLFHHSRYSPSARGFKPGVHLYQDFSRIKAKADAKCGRDDLPGSWDGSTLNRDESFQEGGRDARSGCGGDGEVRLLRKAGPLVRMKQRPGRSPGSAR